MNLPAVRLAYHPEGGRTLSLMKTPTLRLAACPKSMTGANSVEHHTGKAGLGKDPSIRLAVTIEGGGACGPKAMERNLGGSPTVRLAHKDAAQGRGTLRGQGFSGVDMTGKQIMEEEAPALLVSFFYLDPFLKHQDKYRYRDWVMDSGAFSAENSGATINLKQYIDCCRKLLASDPTLTEVYALDVIGNWQQSAENARIMWAEGVPAIPCFHYGSPEKALMELAEKYPKIAIGGCAKMRGDAKMKFARAVFARVWPKRIHGFGFGAEKQIMELPWHSVDATNWEMGPCAFGRWTQFGKMSVRGSNQDLRGEVKNYLKIEEKARARWKKEMLQLAALPDSAPTLRLALGGNPRGEGKRVSQALKSERERSKNPAVRLALDPASSAGRGERSAVKRR